MPHLASFSVAFSLFIFNSKKPFEMYKKSIFTVVLILSSLFFLPNLQAQEPMIGEVKLFAGNFAPRGWAKCEGQLLPIAQNQALFSILGTIYGGDGRTTFALPDLRGRTAVGPGSGPGLGSKKLGDRYGSESVTLTVPQLPSHSHSTQARVPAYDLNPDEDDHHFIHGTNSFISVGNVSGDKAAVAAQSTVGNTGASQPVYLSQPSQVVTYIIALQGIFPSRN